MTLFYLCIAFLAGIVIQPQFGLPPAILGISAVLLFILGLTFRNRFRLAFLCACFLLLGGVREIISHPAAGVDFIGTYQNRFVTLEGNVEEDGIPSGIGIHFRIGEIRLSVDGSAPQSVAGGVRVEFTMAPEDWTPEYGDRITLSGLLAPPPVLEGFDYPTYLARQGVYAVMQNPQTGTETPGGGSLIYRALFAVRRHGLAVLKDLYPDPERALIAGILLGDQSQIPDDVQQAFSHTGTTHLIAISGFNISIIAGIFLSLTGLLPRRFHGWLLALAGIVLYTLLVGATPSVVRAAVMGTLALLARRLGRRSHGLTTLAFSGALMALANPGVVWDAGFQLSFAATLGLILYADPLQSGMERMLAARLSSQIAKTLAGVAGEVFLLTLAAQITTLPVLLYDFQSFSLCSFLVNPLVLSVQPLLMIGAGLAMLLGMIWLPAGQALAWAGWAPAAYTIRVVEYGASFPAGWQPVGEVSIWVIVAFYAILFGATFLVERGILSRVQSGSGWKAWTPAIAVPLLVAAVYCAWNAVFHQPDGRMHLIAMNSGGGDVVLLRSPAGGYALLEADGDPAAVTALLGRATGMWERRLDWVLLSTITTTGEPVIEEVVRRYAVGGVLLPGEADRGRQPLAKFLSFCAEKGITVEGAKPEDTLDFGSGARLRVEGESEGSLVLVAELGNARWLVPDAIDLALSRRLIGQGRVSAVQVLLPIRAQTGWGAADWFRAANPQLGLSLASGDTGWPDGWPVLYVDSSGGIDISTDGERMWVETAR